jgi:hypothetical protein
MSLANSLFVALTNINIPQDQAREVVEALEHKMNDSFATKSDIALIRGDIALAVSRIDNLEESVNYRFEKSEESVNHRLEKHEGTVNHRLDLLLGRLERHEQLTKAEFAAFRNETKAEFASLRADMKAIQTRLVIQLGTLIAVLLGVMPKLTAWLGW